MKNQFESGLGIGESCYFHVKPWKYDFRSLADRREGKIVAVRFTEAKVLYDILDIDFCHLFRDIASDEVDQFSPMIKLEE